MNMKYVLTIACLFVGTMFVVDSAIADSVLDIPKGTIFHLQYELEIPANRDFVLLGSNSLDEAFNGTGQVLNDMDSRPLGYTGTIPRPVDYLTFSSYYGSLFESYEQTYRKCLERHRSYTMVPGTPVSAPIIIQQGRGNVTVFNQGNGTPDEVYSTIGENYCTQPNHTIAALVINRKKAGAGGFFAKDYKFKVKKVQQHQGRLFNVVKIKFDHSVLEGLIIVTTHNPEAIPIGALEARQTSNGGGFWASVGNALSDMTAIGGNYFYIELPDKQYYE